MQKAPVKANHRGFVSNSIEMELSCQTASLYTRLIQRAQISTIAARFSVGLAQIGHSPTARGPHEHQVRVQAPGLQKAAAMDRRSDRVPRTELTWLTRWSDDELKQVWGDQQKMAETFGMAASQIRRYTHEGERAGFLHVHRCAPVRDEMTGRWCRRQTNIYSFTQVPPPTRKRRQKAQDCMSGLSPTGKRSISSLTGTSNRNRTKEESSPKPQRFRPYDERDPAPYADPDAKERIKAMRSKPWMNRESRL
jgi:hypothetical protein